MIRLLIAITLAIALSLATRLSLAQHDECVYSATTGMSGTAQRCTPSGWIGANTDVCMLTGIFGNFHQQMPPTSPVTAHGGDAVYLGRGANSDWTLSAYEVSTSDEIVVHAQCVPGSTFVGGASVALGPNFSNNPMFPWFFAPFNGSDVASVNLGFNAAELCTVQTYSANSATWSDSVDTILNGSWTLNVWGNPDNQTGEAACLESNDGHLAPTVSVGMGHQIEALPPANEALCGFVRLGGPMHNAADFEYIQQSGNNQYAISSGPDVPGATVQCVYFQ